MIAPARVETARPDRVGACSNDAATVFERCARTPMSRNTLDAPTRIKP